MHWKPQEGLRCVGHPRTRWQDQLNAFSMTLPGFEADEHAWQILLESPETEVLVEFFSSQVMNRAKQEQREHSSAHVKMPTQPTTTACHRLVPSRTFFFEPLNSCWKLGFLFANPKAA